MLTQLEDNSFAELIQRNTDVDGLPVDVFSRPDFIFDVAKLGASGPSSTTRHTGVQRGDRCSPAMPDGTIRFGGPEHVVFNGTPAADRIRSSEGDDTLRGNGGNDRMEGGDGNDDIIGGPGDDILTDPFGDDIIKGGDGNDALPPVGLRLRPDPGRPGQRLRRRRRRPDGDVRPDRATTSSSAATADDTVFGDDGDDWIEGGNQADLLQGDNGAPFQDDPNEPGQRRPHRRRRRDDYDSEGGDDIMVIGPGHPAQRGHARLRLGHPPRRPAPANADMDLTGLLPPSVDTNSDRFDLVEALSGWNQNDTLRGDDRDAAAMVGHELTPRAAQRVDRSAAPLLGGATTFTGGNIIIGGAGSDLIEGRGGDDLIDGDAWLNVRISVRTPRTRRRRPRASRSCAVSRLGSWPARSSPQLPRSSGRS